MLNLAAFPPEARAMLLLREVIRPALILLDSLGRPYNPADTRIEILLLAIAFQESEAKYRDQQEMQNGRMVDGALGPALGLWQFEKGGATRGILTHPASRGIMLKLCAHCHVSMDVDSVWRALRSDDLLAAGAARMLCWTDAPPLPATQAAAWTMYAVRTWRPGKPKPEKWPGNWELAVKTVEAAL